MGKSVLELSVVGFVAVLGGCFGSGGGGDAPDAGGGAAPDAGSIVVGSPAVDMLPAGIAHPTDGRFPRQLLDVAWDVDLGRSFGVAHTRTRIEQAPTLAAGNDVSSDILGGQLYAESMFEPFHFWPNILDLTEIFIADARLYADITDQILAMDPNAADVRADLDADVSAGERVILVRDYVTLVTTGDRSYGEVHYAFLINLDDRDVREIRVHDDADRGLGDVHDPLIDGLQAALATTPAVGEVWQMCLRGNQRRYTWDAVVVDYIVGADGGEFWIERVHDACRFNVPDDPDPEIELAIPPPNPPPPPPGGERDKEQDNSLNPARPNPPFLEDMGAGIPLPPIGPWPWPDRPQKRPDMEQPQNMGGSAQPDPVCTNDTAKAAQLKTAVDAQRAIIGSDINGDIDVHEMTRYEWKSGLVFKNDCLKNLYAQYEGLIGPIDAQIAAKQTELAMRRAALKAARAEDVSIALRTYRARQAFWDNMIHVGGTWSNIIIAWTPSPLIPAGGLSDNVLVIGDDLLHTFHKIVVFAMMNGATWDDALAMALADERIYPSDQGIPVGDPTMQLIWNNYFMCLRALYEKRFEDYLDGWLTGASDGDREHAIDLLFDSAAGLTDGERAELDAAEKNEASLGALIVDCESQLDALRKEKTRLRIEYRTRARNECYQAATADFWILFNQSQILEAFANWCASGMANWSLSFYPNDGDPALVCAAIEQLMQEAQMQNCQGLIAFLQMLQQSFMCAPPR